MPKSLPAIKSKRVEELKSIRKRKTSTLTLSRSHALDELKQFIHSFDFWEPDWSPILSQFPDFPNVSYSPGFLSPYEQGILTAIKLAYLNSGPGKTKIKKKIVKAGGVAVVSLTIIAFVQLTITGQAVNVVKSVAAATMSAILR